MVKLDGSVIIVTGSSNGLGAATARIAASKGARVVINYTKSEADAKETAQACKDLGGDAVLCKGNVAEDADCRRMASVALEQWGRIDGLVNNAGSSVFASATDLESLSGEDFLNIYAVNVVGPYQMIRAVQPPTLKAQGAWVDRKRFVHLRNHRRGKLHSLRSVEVSAEHDDHWGWPGRLAPEIRVNAVCPGPIPDAMVGRRSGGRGGEEAVRELREAGTAAGGPDRRECGGNGGLVAGGRRACHRRDHHDRLGDAPDQLQALARQLAVTNAS